ncbi:MAG: hypothetical protein ABJO57_10110 [Lentilitoribacter sp.]
MTISKKERNERLDILEEYGGIFPPLEAFYIASIQYSAERAMDAFLRYQVCISASSHPASIVSTMHEALGHAAALSRFFWPARKDRLYVMRSEKLRTAFNIDESSALKDREIRNALEHFDERLDEFLFQEQAGYFFPTAIVDSHEIADEPTTKIFKLVDPDAGICVILNEKFDFSKVRDEITRILELANQFDANGSRLKQA